MSDILKTDNPTPAQTLLSWYHAVKRNLPWRQTDDPYAIWVSEVMLQQTQVKTVIPYYLRFLERFPSLNELAAAELEEVFSYWRGLGYYARARHLWEGARYVAYELSAEIPKAYQGLRQIPGVGEYTAGAIASIAFGENVPAIDGNVRRILSRILAWPHPVESVLSRRRFQAQLLEWMPANASGDFNQALMELGATVCLPRNPRCSDCPLSFWCEAQIPENYPVKRAKNNPAEIIRLTFILMHEGKFYLQRRPSKGLLAGLLEFPGWELPKPEPSLNRVDKNLHFPAAGYSLPALTPDDIFAFYQMTVLGRSFDNDVRDFLRTSPAFLGPARHTFSHLRWNLYWLKIPIGNNPFPDKVKESPNSSDIIRWVSVQELDTAPIPTAFNELIDDCKLGLEDVYSDLQKL